MWLVVLRQRVSFIKDKIIHIWCQLVASETCIFSDNFVFCGATSRVYRRLQDRFGLFFGKKKRDFIQTTLVRKFKKRMWKCENEIKFNKNSFGFRKSCAMLKLVSYIHVYTILTSNYNVNWTELSANIKQVVQLSCVFKYIVCTTYGLVAIAHIPWSCPECERKNFYYAR